jgi:nitrite reductase/ring-hydroxylating ferredoxin subunit
MREHRVGDIGAIPLNEGRMLRAGPHLVAVFRLRGGGVRAVQPWCPHRGGPLADGLVGNGSLVCPLHGRTFDLASGEAVRGEVGIATYPARVEDDGTIVLSLPEDGALPCMSDAAQNGAAAPDPPFAAPVEEPAE